MPTVYTLSSDDVTVSNGLSISGVSGGNGAHLTGQTIVLESNNWQAIEVTDSDANFQDNQSGSQTLTNAVTVDGVNYAAGLGLEAEYTVVFADSAGNEYTLVAFNIREPGAPNPYGSVEALAFVGGEGGFPPIGETLTFVSAQEGPSVPYSTLAFPPCFTRGCQVMTPNGPRLIEDLEIGDLVETEDHGAQPIRWVATTRLPAASLRAQEGLRPVVIRADAFGAGCPARDTIVSQQHRVLVSGWQAALLYGEDEVLVPAKKLLNDHSILLADAETDVEYFHLIFDAHEILTVDGLKSESFLPSAEMAQIIPMREEFLAIFGAETLEDIQVLPARVCVSDRTAELLDAAL